MEPKIALVNEVTNMMTPILSDEQLQKLKSVLVMKLGNFDVLPVSTELSVVDDSPMNILRQYLVAKKVAGLSERSLRYYGFLDSQMILRIGKPLGEITSFDITYYLNEYRTRCSAQTGKMVSNRTLDNMRRAFSSFFTWCFDNGFIPKNPSKNVERIKWEKKVRKPYSDMEMERIRRACENSRDRAMIEFMYATGCRVSEVSNLNIQDVNFFNRSVMVLGKGNKQRIVYLSELATLYLDEYLASRKDKNICLFAQVVKPYDRLSAAGIERLLKRLGSRAGVSNVHPHRYRRTFATNMLDKGARIQDISVLMGHSSIDTTQIYCYLTQESVHNEYNKYMS